MLGHDLEVGLHAVLGRGKPQLLQPDGDFRRERDVRNVGQSLAAPQIERLPQLSGGQLRLTVSECPSALASQSLEPERVHSLRCQLEPIPTGQRLQCRTLRQDPAEPGYQRLQGVDPIGGTIFRPQCRRQRLHRDHAAGAERQADQERSEPSATDLDDLTIVGHHLERPIRIRIAPLCHRPCGEAAEVLDRSAWSRRGAGPRGTVRWATTAVRLRPAPSTSRRALED
jgi:hypothetical protein